MKTYTHRKASVHSNIIDKSQRQKQLKCPSTDKMSDIHIQESIIQPQKRMKHWNMP
jgi:hypothetical protein